MLGVNVVATAAAVIVLAVVALVALAPWIAPYDPLQQDLQAVLQAPSAAHWLGTDTLGRDTLSRLLFGGQPALTGTAVALAVFAASGILLGLLAGYLGGWVDRGIGVLVDIMLSLPGIIIVLAVLAVFSQNLYAAMITFGFLLSSSLIRVVRGSVLAIREELYVSAAEISGLRAGRIMLRHVLPGVTGPVMVQLALFTGAALGLQTGLGFLGLATAPPLPSWGGMVGEAASVMFQSPFLLIFSGGIITLMTLCFALIGDGVRDINEGRVTRRGGTRARRGLRDRSRAAALSAAERTPPAGSLLRVRDYSIAFSQAYPDEVVRSLDFSIDRGEIVGLVGESGSGKTITGLSLLGLLPDGAAVTSGGAWIEDTLLTGANAATLRRIRGRRIGLVSQEPMVALDPLFTVGSQLDEVLRRLTTLHSTERKERAADLLRSVGLSDPARILRSHPHELSGGMLQRVSIAIALAGEPDLIIADEPTTALDVTVQAGILDLLRSLRDSRGLAVLLITHDLAVVADVCDRVLVMQHGEIVESRAAVDLFQDPEHPYTRVLLESTPSLVEIR
ncbi:dipeptide/oligopeptide/nickel ABC transporter permease/ATP-binding protein [Microbacterium sp. RG1]|nr:dipeptide/oligopeptide/nickel ABC transporter permease/ATP-binding protein [Microbacterium sp. RG1]